MFDNFSDFAQAAIAENKDEALKAAKKMVEETYGVNQIELDFRRDYHGIKYSSEWFDYLETCHSCGKYVWVKSYINGMCPLCVLARPEFDLEISFCRSKSKKYRTALKRAREIPCYVKDNDKHSFRFETLSEYSEYRDAVERLLLVISSWVSFKATLNGQGITAYHIICIRGEINRMRSLTKAVDITFSEGNPIFTYAPPPDEDEIIATDYRYPAEVIDVEAVEIRDDE